MAKCKICGQDHECPKLPSAPLDGTVQACPTKCIALVHVTDSVTRTGVPGVKVAMAGASGPPQTDENGFAIFINLDEKAYTAKITLNGLADKYVIPKKPDGGLRDTDTHTLKKGPDPTVYPFQIDPVAPLRVIVRRADKPNVTVKGVKVDIVGAVSQPATKTGTTGDTGEFKFPKLTKQKYTVTATLDDAARKQFRLEDKDPQKWQANETATQEYELDPSKADNQVVFTVARFVNLTLQYRDPEGKIHPFPKDFAYNAVFDDKSKALWFNATSKAKEAPKVLDDKGNTQFDLENGKTTFTLDFESAKVRYLVHPKAPAKVELLEDQDDEKLRQLTLAEKQFFALPLKLSLVTSPWEAKDVTVPQNAQIAVPADGALTTDKPGQLTLAPKIQYVRFEFYDRKYCLEKHGKKPASIPPVVLKGARKSTAAGAPDGPVAGSHDTISNWAIDKTDAAKACQGLPWVVTKKDDGTDLPKFNKEMLLEFGWEKGFVHSESDTVRKIEELAPNDAKRNPSKDRDQYYDLPKLWKSKCYYTRFKDAAKNKFFDDLAVADDPLLEASLTKDTKLTFSLDDIVLVLNDGTQAIQDKDETDTAKALDKYSRFALLYLDPKDAKDKYKVKIFNPRAGTADYWSKCEFQADAAGTRRNAIIADLPAPTPDPPLINPRAVVFCGGFHDVWDKRTEAADFTKNQILGARAAKLDDSDISAKVVFNQASDVTDEYVHRTRIFDLHYLHYGATDGTTVFSALVTHWSASFFCKAADKPVGWNDANPNGNSYGPPSEDVADKRNYIGKGLKNAMDRWNEKNYQFEEADAKTDHVVKSFFHFEAKEIEDPANTFVQRGGKAKCLVGLGTDNDGSWATETWMFMRRSGYTDEGATWGSGAGTEARENDYTGGKAAARCALAHELGHAAVGLWDDYITQTYSVGVPAVNWGIPTYKTAQRYLGVPYKRDFSAIMNSNQATRLRYFWPRAKWLNDESQAGKKLDKFLKARKFKPTFAGTTKLLFDPAPQTGIYKPAFTETGKAIGLKGKCDLHLYKLGDDEFAELLKAQHFDGILVVETHLCVTYKPGIRPSTVWATGTVYAAGACVVESSKYYVCAAGHTAGVFATNLGANKWVEVDPAATPAAVAANTDYVFGNFVKSGADWYVCGQNHRSGVFANDVAAGKFVKLAGKTTDWTAAQKKQWAGAMNTDIINMLEGVDVAGDPVSVGNGKFWLSCSNAGSPFAKTYVRIFPEWQSKNPADADPADTHFTLVISMDGSAWFSANGGTLTLGNSCDNKTVTRYLYGLLNDDAAGRAGQNLTAAFAEADLAPFKAWVEGKTPGTFTVKKF